MFLRIILLSSIIEFSFAKVLVERSPYLIFNSNEQNILKVFKTPEKENIPDPVVIWHGMGDNYSSERLMEMDELISSQYPGVYIYHVRFYNDSAADTRASIFGNINEEIASAYSQLKEIPELADGFNGIGNSQGGLFLRGYLERYNDPPLRRLITFGAPHFGITDLTPCSNLPCKERNRLLKSQIWSSWSQNNFIAAQFYRNPEEMDKYLEYSNFLADINNEKNKKNNTYLENMKKLETFVMFQFSEDNVIVPKQSAWFETIDSNGNEIPLEKSTIYKEDWLGLKYLNEHGVLKFKTFQGDHMTISNDSIIDIARSYLAPRV